MRSFTGVSVGLALLAFQPKIAHGQSASEGAPSPKAVVGVVRDPAGLPITGVQVRISVRQVSLTDSSGRFRVNGVSEPSLSLTFRRLGYEPASRTISVSDTTRVEVVLMPNSQLLRTILVEGQAYDKDLWANGFYHRQKIGSGSYFDPDYLEHFGGSGLGSLMHEVPRVDVQRQGGQDYAFSTVSGIRCRMNLFVDGVFQRAAMPGPYAGAPGSALGGSDALGLGELVDDRDVRAVEVYPRTSSVPTQFSRMGPAAGPQGRPVQRIRSRYGGPQPAAGESSDAACGAIVIWTKTPGE